MSSPHAGPQGGYGVCPHRQMAFVKLGWSSQSASRLVGTPPPLSSVRGGRPSRGAER